MSDENTNSNQTAAPASRGVVMQLISDMETLRIDHDPDGYPAVHMREIDALVAEIKLCHQKLTAVSNYAKNRGMKTLQKLSDFA